MKPDPEAEARALKERAAGGRSFRLVIVGEVKEGRGQVDAVRATAERVAQGVDAELLVVGDVTEPYGAAVRRLIGELGLGERVRWLGRSVGSNARSGAGWRRCGPGGGSGVWRRGSARCSTPPVP